MLTKAMLPGDEEQGKKDDDHKPRSTPRMPSWAFLNRPLRWRRRRILLTVVGLYLLYVLAQHMPGAGRFGRQSDTYGYTSWYRTGPLTNYDDEASDIEPKGPPPGTRAPRAGEPAPHTYSGPIRFYRLAVSLHGASHTNGYRSTNRNVLFAISSLRSASTLLPMICEMSRWSRNWVHAAFMGMEDIELSDILEINGIDQIKCPAIWHDARPDYMEYSTETRARSSVMAAMQHIETYLHPQVAIIDDPNSEDDFFVRGMQAKTTRLEMPLIQVPNGQVENLMWITRLDSGSLRNWHRPTIDILLQVPSHSSSAMRLLKTLKNADYSGVKPPRLTIELPSEIDESMERYLQDFKWPPFSDESQISIRRRIANQRATQEESAIRFLELSYPSNPSTSHILLLSPQVELSSQYYQYLMYTLLEYKYSSFSGEDSANIMGVSLELPSMLLDGKTKLVPPGPVDMHTTRYEQLFPETESVPFLWQAPNSHATLIFGDKWAELHSFLTNRVAKHYGSTKAPQRPKLVSETLPSWVEYMLEFMRARGYTLYYPGSSSAESLLTIHNELYQAPEEFAPPRPTEVEEGVGTPPKVPDEPFLRADEPAPPPLKKPEPTVIPHSRPLYLALPFDGDLPEVSHLPYLLHGGKMISPSNASSLASAYADKYREVIGGCKLRLGKHRKVIQGSARDLFCFGTEDESDWEDDEIETFEADVVDEYFTPRAKGLATEASSVAPAPTVESKTRSDAATPTASLRR